MWFNMKIIYFLLLIPFPFVQQQQNYIHWVNNTHKKRLKKKKKRHRNDFQRETWMVKKGIESNMVGKKKKETGQIDIYIYIYIYIYLMSNEKCAWFDCIAQRDPVFTYSILKDGQNKCLVVTPNFKTMYQHVILLKEFSKMLLF